MRITILWSELSGYLAACLRTLVEEHQVSLQVFRIKRDQTDIYFHPYQDSLFEWLPELYTLSDGSKKNYGLLRDKIENFSPHILIVSGWRQAQNIFYTLTMMHFGCRERDVPHLRAG